MDLSRFCKNLHWVLLHLHCLQKGEYCLSSFFNFPFPPVTSPVLRIDTELYEQPLWKMNSFQSYGITGCFTNSRKVVIPPVCPWIVRMYINDTFEFSQYSNLVLLLPTWKCWSQSWCEKSRAFFLPKALNNFEIMISQCTAPSWSRSSWLGCLTILMTIFETRADKSSPFHFLSFIGWFLPCSKSALEDFWNISHEFPQCLLISYL